MQFRHTCSTHSLQNSEPPGTLGWALNARKAASLVKEARKQGSLLALLADERCRQGGRGETALGILLGHQSWRIRALLLRFHSFFIMFEDCLHPHTLSVRASTGTAEHYFRPHPLRLGSSAGVAHKEQRAPASSPTSDFAIVINNIRKEIDVNAGTGSLAEASREGRSGYISNY